ncbi:hypothetical protein NC653_030032 [Populus alba x Populus x berolinensis]|uniref:Small ribosomal subunit protein mS38 n=1 Tax=Populus alba x Populus x berolinensis TaxID=444605 RepID=A0AAD6M456_9ROSI|nr:hypothetical protein NC653_030032 [Populus alba x Populus x berolinensis]
MEEDVDDSRTLWADSVKKKRKKKMNKHKYQKLRKRLGRNKAKHKNEKDTVLGGHKSSVTFVVNSLSISVHCRKQVMLPDRVLKTVFAFIKTPKLLSDQ